MSNFPDDMRYNKYDDDPRSPFHESELIRCKECKGSSVFIVLSFRSGRIKNGLPPSWSKCFRIKFGKRVYGHLSNKTKTKHRKKYNIKK